MYRVYPYVSLLVLWEEESKRGRYQGRWLKERQPIIEDLQHEEDIGNEMEVQSWIYNLDQYRPSRFV